MKHSLGETLLRWYAAHRRDLPWRKTKDPYKIWVSEIMLQQTQVQTVIDYYNAWIKRFPDAAALAAAPMDDVLRAWQGLGYYRRARNMHAAAQAIVREHAGVFPGEEEAIRRLPGIGDYTAGAIASIAFDKPVPALDVNVLRVAARVLLLRGDVRKPPLRRKIGETVQGWIPKGKARWFNQALMELGALICLAEKPRCLPCPVRPFCKAHDQGMQHRLPARAAKQAREKIIVVAGVLRDGRGRVLIQKRPPEGLMGDLWEFPGGKVEPGEALAQALAREWKEELGVGIAGGEQLLDIHHAYTRFDVRLHVFACRLLRGRPKALWAKEIRWVAPSDLGKYAFPSANVKIVSLLQKDYNKPSFSKEPQ